MNVELMEALGALEKEKGISKETLFQAIENSLMKACENHFGKADNVKVSIDRETGDYELYRELAVVDTVEDKDTQISLDDAVKIDPQYQIGDIVRQYVESKSFGRIATQNAKNVILQKIREEERRSVYDYFISKEREIVTGIVQRNMGRAISIDLGKADAVLGENEQVKGEHYNPTDRIKVLILEVRTTNRGPRIMVSRTHPDLVRRLFESEVSELADGTVEIRAISREAGSRTKMAVSSNDPDVDPVGACVGVNGSRVNAIVDELGGEKIDIINWSDNSAELIENALSPAKVICVLADDEDKTAQVVVPDYQLSLAIGKVGQNARLAARLTGYKIDIKSETQARESGLFEEIGYIEDYYDDEEDYEEYEDGYEEGEYEEYDDYGMDGADTEEYFDDEESEAPDQE
ncbi:MAG: transcription termination/antitermination protein NusA [Lachnospiraceae bacterium]|nr:transcription termination/antitermination protein NusA [Lachnospiraceae bacterium]